ncbi:hypothetical protein GBZ48_35665, partial [Azospirillum melinis]
MIDVLAVHQALRAPLSTGPIPPEHIGRRGSPFTPPTGDVIHALTSIVWERNGKTGPVLWEGAGMLQILVRAPMGIDEDALLVEAGKVAGLYAPHVDGPALGYDVRVVQVAVMGVMTLSAAGAGGRQRHHAHHGDLDDAHIVA